VSIVVPVFNRARELAECLAALAGQRDIACEIVVVDDGSTDDSAAVAESFGARVVRLARRSGAAHARNEGVRNARAPIVLFIDSDVIAPPSVARHAHDVLAAHPEYGAVFGSYDAQPQASGVVSVFRNLLHHYTHQVGDREAVTFWAGCGAIRKAAFEAVGGFDSVWEGIEDIELGYRLRDGGGRILLDSELQVTHTKRWTVGSMLVTDFRYRATMWSRLILARGAAPDTLNVRTEQRISVALTAVVLSSLVLALAAPVYLAVALAAWAPIVWINRSFYAYLADCRGLGTALSALPLHLLYFASAGLGFARAWAEHALERRAARAASVAEMSAAAAATMSAERAAEMRAEGREP
jgi:glycosyltransferase involved in cell wall biosynthesis